MRIRFLAILILIFLSGCIVGKGVIHTVEKGEDFWNICSTYGVDPQEVAEINNIRNPSVIKPGRKIFIPGAAKVRKVVQSDPEPLEKGPVDRIVIEKNRFFWPVSGEVVSPFGMREGVRHDGIDIKAPEGTPIKAADDGTVVFESPAMRGYGKIIILKHADGFYTVYAHNKENIARQGDKVLKGTVIAHVGKTGNADSYHLHFEVRHGKTVRNPLFFLP